MGSFGSVILAAGASARYGQPKQLLPYRGRTLVEFAAETALESGASAVVVVVGAEAEQVRGKLSRLRVEVVFNPQWAEGMGSSIRCGVAALPAEVDAVVIALSDQPRITPHHLSALVRRVISEGVKVVASSYAGVIGAPCAFARSEFPRLLALQGDAGARGLLRDTAVPIESIPFPDANLDVDTPADYDSLVSDES